MKDITKLLNKIENKVAMIVFPHPDDETMATGGLLMLLTKLGFKTMVVILTHGERGKMLTDPQGRTTREVRKMELRKAAKILNVDKLIQGDFGDANLMETKTLWVEWLSGLMSEYSPGIVVTYDHSGITAHPDHIVLSVELKKLVPASTTLLWATAPRDVLKKRISTKSLKYLTSPDYELCLGIDCIKKWKAVRAHKSQPLGMILTNLYWLVIVNREWYHKVEPKRDYPYKFFDFKI